MAPNCKGMGGVTLVLFMFVCGALSFSLPAEFIPIQRSWPFQGNLRLDMDGQSTCDSGTEAGICYDALNCLKVSGMFGNNCPRSQGVCCLFYRQCGQQSSQEVSYFQNTDVEARSGCNYRVVKRSPRYCRMRVNLEQLELPTNCQTSLSIEGIDKGKNIGKLRFPERRNDEGSDAEKICSTEAGLEYDFETRNLDEILVNVESSGGMTGKWKIRVTQVQCKDDDGVEAANEHASHIPAIWPPPIITHPPTPSTPTPAPSSSSSTATCWWNCDKTPAPKPTPPTIPPRPEGPTETHGVDYSACGIRGPNVRSGIEDIPNIRTSNAETGELEPFLKNDTVYGNPSRNDSVFAKVVSEIPVDEFTATGFWNRITFGSPSGPREYPWQVGMKVRGRFHCGASIIGDQYILTAAHCVTKYKSSPRTLYLTLGDYDLTTSREQRNVVPTVERVTVHPQYSRTTLRNDLAVLKLTKKIVFTENIRPVCLAPAGLVTTDKIAIVTGWGRDENNRLVSKLHELVSDVVSNNYCGQQWVANGAPRGFITNDMMCMSPIGGDSCNGDSGGPSITDIDGKQYQIGIVSFGSGSCVDESLPGVYTRITSYRDWIIAQMN